MPLREGTGPWQVVPLPTAWGLFQARLDARGRLGALYFPGEAPPAGPGTRYGPAPPALAEGLRHYLNGDGPLPTWELAPGGSVFERQVWAALLTVPYGSWISYGELAVRAGRPGAARAVGGAMARNPVPLFIACHRVLGSRGELTGYGPGLDLKARLLALEGIRPRRKPAAGRKRCPPPPGATREAGAPAGDGQMRLGPRTLRSASRYRRLAASPQRIRKPPHR
ncbi:MAG: MGMT family protein [Firmicutes bacterium]|nr:MGMT family protein [Bacillota bacterium]